jgi:hypothetical protein
MYAPNTLVLAQLCTSRGYRTRIKQKLEDGDRIILDNGAHEGIDIDLNEYKQIALDLLPSVVVLTDLVGRSNLDSRKQSLEFIRRLSVDDSEKFMRAGTKFMYVPQGQTKDQVLYDYAWALDNLSSEQYVIGLGQGYLCWVDADHDANDETTRAPMIEQVMEKAHGYPHEFHVLGARWAAGGCDYSIYENITGIDSIKPCTCASFGLTYPQRPPKGQRSVDRMSAPAVDEKLLLANVEAFCLEYKCTDE